MGNSRQQQREAGENPSIWWLRMTFQRRWHCRMWRMKGRDHEYLGRERISARTQSSNPLNLQIREPRLPQEKWLIKASQARDGILFSRLTGSDISYTSSHSLNIHMAKLFKVHEDTSPWIVKERREHPQTGVEESQSKCPGPPDSIWAN